VANKSLQDKVKELENHHRSLVDALGEVMDWVDGESPGDEFDSYLSTEDQDARDDKAREIWWKAEEVLKKAKHWQSLMRIGGE